MRVRRARRQQGAMIRLRRGLEVNFNLYVKRRIPTIVYAMGRVGSVALFRSLYAHGEFAIHAHILHPANMRAKGKRYGTPGWAHEHVIARRKRVRIISLVRNPLECMVSAFAPELTMPPVDGGGVPDLPSAELTRQFTSGYFDERRHREKLNWFETEFKPALGIDVYEHPFHREKGYARFREGACEVLILRTEMDDLAKAQVISDFLELRNFKVIRANVGEQQSYGDAYRVFKERVRVPEAYLDEVLNSRFARHFFTPETLDATRSRFTSGGEGRPNRVSRREAETLP